MRSLRSSFCWINEAGKPQLHPIFEARTRTERATHAGLWLDRYLREQDEKGDNERNSRRDLVREVASIPVPTAYNTFFQRWKVSLSSYGVKPRDMRLATVKGRMIVGLGDESVLETSVALHHTYGVPYIPGSALKGLVASYLRQQIRQQLKQRTDLTKETYKEAYQAAYAPYKTIFGDTDEAGYIVFFDALYQPEPGTKNSAGMAQPLHPDIITVHHPRYYQNEKSAPADWDSPNPVPFLSATGSYLIVLSAPDLLQGRAWIDLTFELLGQALKDLGIGAKTSSGYGRMELAPPPVDLRESQIEGYIRELKSLADDKVPSQINTHRQRWQSVKDHERAVDYAKAILEKVRNAGQENIWKRKADNTAWYQELLDATGPGGA